MPSLAGVLSKYPVLGVKPAMDVSMDKKGLIVVLVCIMAALVYSALRELRRVYYPIEPTFEEVENQIREESKNFEKWMDNCPSAATAHEQAVAQSLGNDRPYPDTDGVPLPYDCVEGDPEVYPGAPELCGDNRDNNCNFEVDEGCPKK